LVKLAASTAGRQDTLVEFECNICGSRCEVDRSALGRETPSCGDCGSTARWRSVVHALSMALFREPLSILDFPVRHDLKGIGLTDDWRYADRLPAKLGYTNTYYDREPWLDIMEPADELIGGLDFLISSDVFEHVHPPVKRAFDNVYRLLKPGGCFILTVPYNATGETKEHFPNLNEYEIVDFGETPVLLNRTVDGRWEVFDDIRFHGGIGATLEMRAFSRPSLLEVLRETGFEEVTEFADGNPAFGLDWSEAHGFPFVARRPGP
jgi:SAM-dependent methyltransferase